MAITKVTTDVITDGAVTAPKLATDSVTADKLAANSVTAAKIAAGTLTDQVANNSITAAKIPNATALTLDGGVTIDNINIDGTTMALSSGDLTLDVAGDIILDADGGDVKFYDGGTNIGNFVNSSSDFAIEAMVQDKDIIFKGDDGGSGITALTLDMSEAGTATFNSVVNIGTDSGTQPSYFNSYLNVQNNASTSSSSSITITAGSGGYAGLHFGDSDNGRIGQVAYNNSDNTLLFTANNSERMRITSDGLLPATTSTYDLGSSSLRWANLYTGDLHLSNEGSEGNEVDGTSGDWTIQEGDEHLYIKNNKSGKKYRFALEEIE